MIVFKSKTLGFATLSLFVLSGCVIDLDKKEGDPVTYNIPKNSWQAVRVLKEACSHGDQKACKMLDDWYAQEAIEDQKIIDFVRKEQLNK